MNTCRTCKYRDLDKYMGSPGYYCGKLSTSYHPDKNNTIHHVFLVFKECTCEHYEELSSVDDAIETALLRVNIMCGYTPYYKLSNCKSESFHDTDQNIMSKSLYTKDFQEHLKRNVFVKE